jgi:gamma-glutamyltranspeptidase/glutathione hydrolase
MDADALANLEARGHRIQRAGPWSHGRVMAVTHDRSSGLCEAGASPRSQVAYAIALP